MAENGRPATLGVVEDTCRASGSLDSLAAAYSLALADE